MKRGPRTLLTSALQKRICDLLANANTIQTAAAACGIGERTYHDWVERHAAFAAATREARAKAKIKLVNIIQNAARKNAHFACWLLERSWRDEYARTERIETQPAEQKENSLRIFYDTQGASLSELLTFPIDPSMHTDSEGEAATEEVHYAPEEAEVPPEAHDAPPQVDAPPPPQVVFKPLTGRIRPEWKGNGKKE
jgi:hypothetical protein